VAWLGKYILEARPQIALEPDDLTVFLTAQGEPFSRDHLTFAGSIKGDVRKKHQFSNHRERLFFDIQPLGCG
jgi:integrase/recombinase XerD